MHNSRLPRLRGDRREFPRQAIRRAVSASRAEGVSQRRNLARLKPHCALRKPADAGAERLLAQFHAAAVFRRANQYDEQSFGF